MEHRPILAAVLCAVSICAAGCEGIDHAAEKEFLGSGGAARVSVYPAIVRRAGITYDADEAGRLAQGLVDQDLARAVVARDEVPMSAGWKANQAAMWSRSVREFRVWLAAHPDTSDYAVLPEYLIQPRGAVGIHVYVLDRQGRLAFGRLYNSHWKEMRGALGRGPSVCTDVLLTELRVRLGAPDGRGKR